MTYDSKDLFKLAVKILTENNVNYWVCHGTLLGIIRDNEILPWDHDVDFAVWDDEFSKKDIIKIFSNDERFKQKAVLEKMNSLHFSIKNSEDKRLDINFYSRDKNKAFIKWAILSSGLLPKIYNFSLNSIASDISLRKIIKSKNGIIIQFIKLLISFPLILIRYILPKRLKKLLNKDSFKKYDFVGYSFPVGLMKNKKIKFLDVDISVPVNSEEVLRNTYGENWRIPKKDYIWYKDAKNILHLN
tara:strand:+ start:11688 stop:12419 length:732 start_codon:yes stop_codon:yes gene_type:complete